MRYDRNYIVFAGHCDWYTMVEGIGCVPTEKAPSDAIEAMKRYNVYTFPFWYN